LGNLVDRFGRRIARRLRYFVSRELRHLASFWFKTSPGSQVADVFIVGIGGAYVAYTMGSPYPPPPFPPPAPYTVTLVLCVTATLLLLFFVRGLVLGLFFIFFPFLAGMIVLYYDAIEILVELVRVHVGEEKLRRSIENKPGKRLALIPV
jgi:hypothetical protein